MKYQNNHIGQNKYSDERLCALAQSGEKQAEEQLVLRYHGVVESIARAHYLEGGEDHDLSQEGMIGLIKAIRAFGIPFEAFVRICVRREIFKAIRGAAAEKHQPLNHSQSLVQLDLSCAERSEMEQTLNPEAMLIGQEDVLEKRQKLLQMLSPLETSIFKLQLEGHSYEEMAAAVHKSVKSVDNAVQRIRRKAATIFSDEYR